MLKTRRWSAGLAFGLAFVINPAFLACGPVVDEPNFGEAEMLQSLDAANDIGQWAFVVDGVDYDVELSLMQTVGSDVIAGRDTASPFGNVAYACGNRTFMQSASACSTQTQLVVEGELTLRRIDANGATEIISAESVHGHLTAGGDKLTSVRLQLMFGINQSLALSASDSRTYELASLYVTDFGADQFSLVFNRTAATNP